MPQVTILIPIYNEDKYILETLKSIQEQSYKNFVCLISNNNSVDNSEKICKEFIKNDNRFIYYKQLNNIGSIENVNFLLSQVKTKYSMLFSGHDIINKLFLSKCINILDKNDDISLVFSKFNEIDELGTILKDQDPQIYNFTGDSLSRYIQSVKKLSDCTIVQGVFRSNVVKEFKFKKGISGPDHIFLSHLLWHGKLAIIDDFLYKRRYFKKRDSEYHERITGSKYEYCKYELMYKEYLNNFNTLYKGSNEFRNYLNYKILDILTERFGFDCLNNK